MKELHALSIAEQDALLLRIYTIASRKAAKVIRSASRADILQDVMLSCLEALRAATFSVNLGDLDAFITTALQQRAAELRGTRKDEREAMRDYRREVMMDLHQSNARLRRASMRRKVNLWRPEVQRNTKGTPPTLHQARQKGDVIRRSSMLGRRLAAKAKEQTKWRVRRRERGDRTTEGANRAAGATAGDPTAIDGPSEAPVSQPEPIDGSDDSVVRRPGPIDRSS